MVVGPGDVDLIFPLQRLHQADAHHFGIQAFKREEQYGQNPVVCGGSMYLS